MLPYGFLVGQGQSIPIDHQVDSVTVLISESTSSIGKRKHLFERGELHRTKGHFNNALSDFQLVLQRIENNQNPILYTETCLILGEIYQNPKVFNLDSSLHYSEQAYQLYDQAEEALQTKCLIRLTNINYALFRFERATEYCLECIQLCKKNKDNKNLRYCYNRMAAFSQLYLNDEHKVKEYTDLALSLALEEKDVNTRAYYYLASGSHYSEIGLLEQALSYFDSCEKYINKGTDKHLLADLYLGKGEVNIALNQYEFGEENYMRAWKYADSLNLFNRQMHAPLNLAKLALIQKKYRKVIEYSQHVLTVVPEKLTLFELDAAYQQLYLAHKGLNEYDKALQYFEIWNTVKDSVDNINNVGVITGLERKYKNLEQKQQIESQLEKINVQIKQRDLMLIFFIILILFLIGLSFFYLKIKTSNSKIKKQNLIILEQSDKLHQLDKIKSRFFTNVSHELRTPLTLMLGPISSVLKRGKLDNRDFTFLATAKQNGQSLLKLVSSILDLSKMEAGKMQLNEKTVVLYRLVRRITATFESYALRNGIQFSFIYDTEKSLQLILDSDKLEVILNNLLSNAMKFTVNEGRISIEIKDLTNCIHISVSDTGRGIHPEDLPNIFNRFYQSRQEDAIIEGGTGIGLALSQEFAKLMTGVLSVKSELGKGSTFLLELPRKEFLGMIIEEEEQEEILQYIPAQNEASSTKRKLFTLLIVEDNYSLRNYLNTILSPYYNTQTAGNGKEALDILSQQTACQLVLSDIMMPVMDGYQLLEKLKSSNLHRHIPVIMLTARADMKDKLKALQIGVDDYLLKPFDEEELLARIENLLNNFENRSLNKQVDKEEPIPSLISENDRDWLNNFEVALRKNIGDPAFSISSLTFDLELSESTLLRQLKRITGLTPGKYLQEIRLNEARILLENNPQTLHIREVALKVGYSNPKAFTRIYKKRFGKLPSEV